MLRILYHGSTHIIEKPKFGAGRDGNDFGKAFYCTLDENLSREWACSLQLDGYSNKYQFDDSGLNVFDLECGKYHILNWLAILLENRNIKHRSDLVIDARNFIIKNFLPDYKYSDVIVGYRADDSFFGFANEFLNNQISISSLDKLMRLGELGKQYAIRSKKAFNRIKFIDAKVAEADIYYYRFNNRDLEARNNAIELRRPDPAGIYIIDIMRGNWDDNDERLQRFIC